MSAVASVRVIADIANELGEGVTWCTTEHCLYWTDIAQAQLWRYHPADGDMRTWPMPERLGCLALTQTPGWLLLGFASRLALWHVDSGECIHLHTIEPNSSTRINDGACDRSGRFVFAMFDEAAPKRPIGGIYRLARDFSLQRLPLPGVAIGNGIAFSADGTRLYYCDSAEGLIRYCDYAVDGRLGAPQIFAAVDQGEPDGAAVDANDHLWSAHWGASRLVRYAPDGRVDRIVDVPVRQPTRCAFGGADLQRLFVTSAWLGLDAAARARDAQAGALLAIENLGIRGLPEPRFAGDPAIARTAQHAAGARFIAPGVAAQTDHAPGSMNRTPTAPA